MNDSFWDVRIEWTDYPGTMDARVVKSRVTVAADTAQAAICKFVASAHIAEASISSMSVKPHYVLV